MRIPASIGIGMAKKKAEREARALEEAIAAGMVKRKGMGNKKKREQKANIDRGLAEDGGAFRNGVLKVAPGAQSLGVRNRGSGGGKWRGGGGGGKRGRR